MDKILENISITKIDPRRNRKPEKIKTVKRRLQASALAWEEFESYS